MCLAGREAPDEIGHHLPPLGVLCSTRIHKALLQRSFQNVRRTSGGRGGGRGGGGGTCHIVVHSFVLDYPQESSKSSI